MSRVALLGIAAFALASVGAFGTASADSWNSGSHRSQNSQGSAAVDNTLAGYSSQNAQREPVPNALGCATRWLDRCRQ